LQRVPQAIQSYRDAHRAAPGYVEAVGALAQALIATHEYQSAADLLGAYLEKRPEDARVLLARGQALFCLNDFDAALPPLQRAAALKPDDWPAQMFALYAARESGRWDLEAEIFETHRKALARGDDGPTAAQGLLYFPFTLDELHKLAVARFKR